MKQLLLLGCLMLSSLTSFAQTANEAVIEKAVATTYDDTKSATVTVYNDGKSLVKQIYEDGKSMAPDIKAAFKSLADGFNTTVEALWDILVRQQYVWSICYTILLIITIFGWYKFGNMFNKTISDKTEVGEIKTLNVIYTVVLASLSIYGTLHVGDNLDRMITGFVNPEFGAVRTIIEFIQN